MSRRPKTDQFDLFANADDGRAMQTPAWQALPVATRQALTTLIQRLLLDHAAGDHTRQAGEWRHEL